MSRRCVRYEGEGKHRRPIYADEGPSSAAAEDPISAIENRGLPELRELTGGAGTVERRKATPEELAAARAREGRPDHLTRPTNGTPGVIVHHAHRPLAPVLAVPVDPPEPPAIEPEPQPEEEPMPEISSESPADIPDDIPSDIPAVDVGLDVLALAAEKAHQAWVEKAAADTAWDIAREALARAYGQVEWMVEPLPPQPDDDHVHQVLTVPMTPTPYVPPATVGEVVARQAPKASRRGPAGRHAGSATERQEKAERADRVIDALTRHHDNVSAAAAELGMRPNAVAMVAKHARARQAVHA